MKKQIAKTGIILNYLSLIYILIHFTVPESNRNMILLFSALTVLAISFIFIYLISGHWRFAHLSQEKLDERELMQNNQAIKISYAVFSIFSVMFFYLLALYQIPVHIVQAAGILYLAHILPVSVCAWQGHK